MNALGRLARLRLEWWAMLAVCLAGTAGLQHSGLTARLDHIVYDFILSKQSRPTPDSLLIVALDDRSLAEAGAWPWTRAQQAALVDRIAAGRPRAIGLDILLTEPRDPAGDQALAEAIGRAGNVFLPLAFDIPGHDGRLADPLLPLPAFARRSAGIGHVNLAPDSDGVMRESYLAYRSGAATWPALPAAMTGRTVATPAAGPGLERAEPLLIAYPGPAGTVPAVPASRVLRGEVPGELIAGRFVLVGMTASGLGDTYATPTAGGSPLMPGVEIQASLLASLLAPDQLRPVPQPAALGFSLLAVLLLFVALWYVPSRLGGLAALALLVAPPLLSFALLHAGGLWLPPATAMAGVAVSSLLWAWRRLAVASAHVSQELERASAEAGELARPAPAGGGMLERQLALLADTTARERELRLEHDAVIRLLSHDMRAPQSSILALLEPGAGAAIEPELAERIRGYAGRTLDLADGFVHLSRAQLLSIEPVELDLVELARDAEDAVWPRARARQLRVRVDEPGGEVLVAGDPSLLARMLINLVDNAVKYAEPASTIVIALNRDGSWAGVEVCNRGPAIPPDQLGRLFAQFARLPDAVRRTDGVGLGLAFVQTVVQRHGGTIACHSADGETRFSVRLPRAHP